jgi:membrane protease YdiL (CAAX protease family)
VLPPLAFAALLVLYGNGVQLAIRPGLPGTGSTAAAFGVALAIIVLLAARSLGLSRLDLGLTTTGGIRAAAVGALGGAAVAAASLVVMRFPPLLAGPVSYAPVSALGLAQLAPHVLFFLPLAVVLPEELAFRGVLLALLRRRLGLLAAAVASAFPFALWHAAIVFPTVSQTNLREDALFFALGLSGAWLALLVGGVAFALLRVWTGHLAGSFAAHWVFNAGMLTGLWLLARA